jgi:hypothetical protein
MAAKDTAKPNVTEPQKVKRLWRTPRVIIPAALGAAEFTPGTPGDHVTVNASAS